MNLIEINYPDYKNLKFEDNLSVAIGNFDGIHVGHQLLINEILKDEHHAVITFSPHPSIYLEKLENRRLITPKAQKIKLFEKLGVKNLIIFKLSDEFMRMSKSSFIDLLKHMNVSKVVCGSDFRFGYKALGNTEDLKANFETKIFEKTKINDVVVSSSYIRQLILDGRMEEANTLLTREFSIVGKVIFGRQVGRKIQFPTANVAYGNYILPKIGVYFGHVIINNKKYGAMINVGHNPTINQVSNISLEAHILDFSDNIYYKNIEVSFVSYLRDEIKFKNIIELVDQLKKDKEICQKKFLAEENNL